MIALFYDRKHRCEVTSAQLMGVNVIESYASCDDADDRQRPAVRELWNSSRIIGELAYKTPDCPKHQNWDRYLMTGDLVFLRMDDEHAATDGGEGRWCGKQWGGGETVHVCDLEKHEGPCHWPGK